MAEITRSGISDRQQEIIGLVRDRGYVSIDMLAERFGVSQQTVRRDIIFLAEQNLVQRHHGGAGLPPGTDTLAYSNRKIRNAAEKALIGQEIAKQIPNGASVFIDIGTTMEAVADALIGHEGLRIITNHIGVVSTLCEHTDFEIILTGGLVRNRDRAITGESTTEFIRNFRVGYGIFGIGSLTEDGQLLDYHYRDAQASRAALEISKVKFVGIDHSKFNTDAMMPFAHVSEVDALFTDREPPAGLKRVIDESGCDLFVARDDATEKPLKSAG
ncbi:MAG: DeoR family transcriptional regulator [Rhodospirillales bacterium]|nr:DeoR family transcriptional regulator [Rhodospirillales bacterium]